jgi:predicted methyltransferase
MNYHAAVKFLFLACLLTMPALADTGLQADEERSVSPGINSYYRDPNWQQWVNTFERPGREVYDRRHAIVDATGVRPGDIVADIGAGTGLFTRLFAERVGPGGRVYAVDISDTFIKNIMRAAKHNGYTNIEGVVNNDRDVLLPMAAIDTAFLVDTYHHFEYPRSMLSSIHASLKPGGVLIIIDFQRDPRHSSRWVMGHVRAGKDTVIEEVTDAGFRLVDDIPLLRTNYYLVFRKLDS